MIAVLSRSGRALAALLALGAAGAGVAQGGCSAAQPPAGYAPPPPGRSLGYLPEGRARQVGINLHAVANIVEAGFTPAFALLADDAMWFDEMAAVPVGASVPAQQHAGDGQKAPPNMWRDMGFLADAQGGYRRAADIIGGLPELVPTHVPELPHIDCIATISIDRHNGAEPYLYATLRSLFASFPAGVHINVLVSNTDVGYVSQAALASAVGEAYVGQVHVHAVDAQAADYLTASLPPYCRGGWNYARALRSYAGDRGLILMEDDVLWTRGGAVEFDAWLAHDTLPAASLFNNYCEQFSGEKDHTRARFRINKVVGDEHYFMNLQGMYYHHAIANSLGRYLQLRMHAQIYDQVVGWFFHEHKTTIGFAFPSITQHIGRRSAAQGSGFSWDFHDSRCFREAF